MSLSERASFGELFLEVISGREVTLRVCAGANDCGFDNAELCVEACVVSSSSCVSSERFGLVDAPGADDCFGCLPGCAPSVCFGVLGGHGVFDEGVASSR
jgi:hypothetical protein